MTTRSTRLSVNGILASGPRSTQTRSMSKPASPARARRSLTASGLGSRTWTSSSPARASSIARSPCRPIIAQRPRRCPEISTIALASPPSSGNAASGSEHERRIADRATQGGRSRSMALSLSAVQRARRVDGKRGASARAFMRRGRILIVTLSRGGGRESAPGVSAVPCDRSVRGRSSPRWRGAPGISCRSRGGAFRSGVLPARLPSPGGELRGPATAWGLFAPSSPAWKEGALPGRRACRSSSAEGSSSFCRASPGSIGRESRRDASPRQGPCTCRSRGDVRRASAAYSARTDCA